MQGVVICKFPQESCVKSALKIVMRLKMPGPLKSKVKWKGTISLEELTVGGNKGVLIGPPSVPLRQGCY